MAQFGRAPALGAGDWGFESLYPDFPPSLVWWSGRERHVSGRTRRREKGVHASLAQWIEHWTTNPGIGVRLPYEVPLPCFVPRGRAGGKAGVLSVGERALVIRREVGNDAGCETRGRIASLVGPTDRTPASEAGDGGSIPSRGTGRFRGDSGSSTLSLRESHDRVLKIIACGAAWCRRRSPNSLFPLFWFLWLMKHCTALASLAQSDRASVS
jgi:hypothetical protein